MKASDSFDYVRKIASKTEPKFRYNVEENFDECQKKGKDKLAELLGLPFEKCDDNFEIEYKKDCNDYSEIRFTFTSEEDYVVPCHILMPKASQELLVPVICLQGHSTGMHISLGKPKYENDSEMIGSGDRDFAVRTVKAGCAAIVMEQRYMGECGGSEKGPGCLSEATAMNSLLYGRTAIGERVWDVMRLIDVMEKYFDCFDMSKLICLGNSGGGTTTFYAACLDERISCAVPSCAVCAYKDSIGAMFHCCCNYVPHIAKYFDMGDLGGLIVPRGLIVVNGENDPIFPKCGVNETVEIIKNFYTLQNCEENFEHLTGNGGHRFYADIAWDAIRKIVKIG